MIHRLTPFTTTPDICTISYSCFSVTRSDGYDSYNNFQNCDKFTVEGVLYGGTGDDNEISFSALESQYTAAAVEDTIAPGTYTVTIIGIVDEDVNPSTNEY